MIKLVYVQQLFLVQSKGMMICELRKTLGGNNVFVFFSFNTDFIHVYLNDLFFNPCDCGHAFVLNFIFSVLMASVCSRIRI